MENHESSSNKHLSERLLSAVRHERYLALLACLGLVVTLGVVGTLMQRGIAMVHTETILDCHYDGVGAHIHNADCYDKGANLVCPLPEREFHIHDDFCYIEELLRVCGLEEGEGHTHTEDCYETNRVLACGKEEVTEEHVHGPGCFTTITVRDDEYVEPEWVDADEGAEAEPELEAEVEGEVAQADSEMPAQVFDAEIVDAENPEVVLMRVHVDAPEGAFPAGTTMRATLVDPREVESAIDEAVATRTSDKVTEIQAVDITFHDEQGTEIEPATKITVKLTSDLIAKSNDPMVVHLDNEGAGSVIDTLNSQELEQRNETTGQDELVFDAGQ